MKLHFDESMRGMRASGGSGFMIKTKFLKLTKNLEHFMMNFKI